MTTMTTMTQTENGALTLASSGSAAVNLFFAIGSSRNNTDKLIEAWNAVWAIDPALALRIALWGRDVRGGAGEREAFRAILRQLDQELIFCDTQLLQKIAEVGRADDLLVVDRNFPLVAAFYKQMIGCGDQSGLFAKWAPRQGPIANRLRKEWGFATPKAYRQYIVSHTKVVEQAMCAKDWSAVEYSHVPSVAMARYNAAFARNDADRFVEYREALKKGNTTIHAGAVFPHDIVRAVGNEGWAIDADVVNEQWKAQPNYIGNGSAILPMCDVSGSMCDVVSGSGKAMDVSIALGLYISERQVGPFRDMVLTFSDTPEFHKVTGDNIVDRIQNLSHANWNMSTNLSKAFSLILSTAIEYNVPAADMPTMLVILSDMEFNIATRNNDLTNHQVVVQKYEAAGYKMPKIVYWNLNSRSKSSPVSFREDGTALVSGFSTAILTSLLSADDEKFTPFNIMMNTVSNERYDVPHWTV